MFTTFPEKRKVNFDPELGAKYEWIVVYQPAGSDTVEIHYFVNKELALRTAESWHKSWAGKIVVFPIFW